MVIIDAHSHDWDADSRYVIGWDAARIQDPMDVRITGDSIFAVVDHATGDNWLINRGGLVLDTSELDPGLEILSATLYIHCGNKYATASGSLVLADANAVALPADVHAFADLVGLTEITRKIHSDIAVDEYTAIAIPASVIQKGSLTHIGIYFSADFDDDDGIVPSGKVYGFGILAQESLHPPYLEINLAPTPAVITKFATDVGIDHATLNGEILDVGAEDCDQRGFDYKKYGEEEWQSWVESDSYEPGEFSHQITDLEPSYYLFRAKAHNPEGWGYGLTYYFSTTSLPTVITLAASGIGENLATLNGEIGYLGDAESCDKWGFDYKKDGDEDWTHEYVEDDGFGLGTFSWEGYFERNTKYYFRAKAHNQHGWGYGSVLSFSTLPPLPYPPQVTTQDSTNITINSATGNGAIVDTGGETIKCDRRGFEWGTTKGVYPNEVLDSGSYGADAFSKGMTSLPSGTWIYHRAKARNDGGWGYGGEVAFVTLIDKTVAEDWPLRMIKDAVTKEVVILKSVTKDWPLRLVKDAVTKEEVTLKEVTKDWPFRLPWDDIGIEISGGEGGDGEIRDEDLDAACVPKEIGLSLEMLLNESWRLVITLPADGLCNQYFLGRREFWLRKRGALVNKFKIVNRKDIRRGFPYVRCEALQIVDWLAEELISGIYSATGKTVTQIFTDLLAYQELTPAITLGGVDAGLDKTLTLDIKWMYVIEAIQRIRDIVGGYLYVDVERSLWLKEDIGDDVGQQIRYRKNLRGIEKDTDYTTHCTKLYALGSGEGVDQVTLEDVTVTSEEAIKSQDVPYGYLTLGGKYSCYEGFTGAGNNPPLHITVWKGLDDDTANWKQHTDQILRCLIGAFDPGATYTLNYNHAAYIKSDTIDAYGIISRPFADKETDNAVTLLIEARSIMDVAKIPTIIYSIEAVNLEEKLTFEELGLGDKINIIDEEFGINVKAMVTRIYFPDFKHLENITIDTCTRSKDITDMLKKLEFTDHAFKYHG